jgi:hypothetical protein
MEIIHYNHLDYCFYLIDYFIEFMVGIYSIYLLILLIIDIGKKLYY